MPIMFIVSCVFLSLSVLFWCLAYMYKCEAEDQLVLARITRSFNTTMGDLYKGYLDQAQNLHDEVSNILEYTKELNEEWIAAKEQFEAKYNVQITQVIDPITNKTSVRILSM